MLAGLGELIAVYVELTFMFFLFAFLETFSAAWKLTFVASYD